MLSRLAIAGVVFFWLLMNGALVRLWVNPNQSEILAIPVEHVVKQIFLHEQISNLVIFQGQKRVGSLTLQPRRFDTEGYYVVDFTGNLLLQIPFVGQQPFSWRGVMELDPLYAVRKFKIHIDSRSPAVTTDIEIDFTAREATYSIQYEAEEAITASVPLSQEGLNMALQAFNIDATLLESILAGGAARAQAQPDFSFTARQSQIKIHGESVQAFQLSARQAANTLLETDISQLGQVLGIRTAVGFTLTPDDTLP